MARTALTVETIGRLTSLSNPTRNAAHADGNSFDNSSEKVFLYVTNNNAATLTVTIVRPGNDSEGVAKSDIPYTVLTGARRCIGPFPANEYNQSSTDKTVYVDWDITTDVLVEVLKLPAVSENI